MSDRFAGRVAIVTGGASGIGLAVATQIGREGGRVALWDLAADRLETAKAESGAQHIHAVDVSDEDRVSEAFAATVEALGPVDILVTSAGIIGPFKGLGDLSYAEWRHVCTLNLDGTFLCCKAVVPSMRERGYGRIATIASIAGKEGAPAGVAYGASKAAVISLTKSLGKELAASGIVINTITPGATDTPMAIGVPPEVVERMKSAIPMGRLGKPQEMAEMICFMVSDACSFTTGAVFDASGGRANY